MKTKTLARRNRYVEFAHKIIDCNVEPDSSPPKPYDHQVKAWEALKKKQRPIRGIIALPTGAGKTFTAVHWLAKNVLSEPTSRPVLWIAHRAELLQQATEELNKCRSLCRREAKLELRCISGAHGKPISTLLANADVTFVTIQSLSRREDLVKSYLKKHPSCVIVVDEAHHAAAKSYRKVLGHACKRKNVEILGLTATPTRTLKGEIKYLKDIFSQRIIYQVSLPDLIEKGILSRPICETVTTNHNFDKLLTDRELKQLEQFGELPPSVLSKIAKSVSRNKLIVNHFLKNQDDYRKTLIFAANIPHCYSLANELKKKGVAAEYVASKRDDKNELDPSDSKFQTIIDKYRKGQIQVLVNVEMLTEGVDLPKTETVLLARPTGSEILMRQMVGRALRGPKAGGSKEARIVSFADHWERFPGWLDPISFLDPVEQLPEDVGKKKPPRWNITIPWELISALSAMSPDVRPNQVLSSAPVGWYALPKGDPEIEHTTAILVYDHQLDAFERFLRDSGKRFPVLSGAGGAAAKYFADVPDPVPTNEQLKRLHYYAGEFGKPTYISFVERDEFDPYKVALANANKTILEIKEIATKVYEETLACKVYRDVNSYIEAVFDELSRIMTKPAGPVDIIREGDKARRRPVPYKDWPLKKLMRSVLEETRLDLEDVPKIRWSKTANKSTWGIYRGVDNTIVINRFLRTSAVERRTIEFLIYHELLHCALGIEEGHSKYFREREREFEGYTEAEADLDSLTERIGPPREDFEITYK